MPRSGPGRARDIGRKWESGASKKRRRKLAEANTSLKKLLEEQQIEPDEDLCTLRLEPEDEEMFANIDDPDESINSLKENESDNNEEEEQKDDESVDEEEKEDDDEDEGEVDYSDPGLWKLPMSESRRRAIIQKGPVQTLNTCDDLYPKDSDRRHFSNFHYVRKLVNGESFPRRWLVYSTSSDRVFCFPCRLFSESHGQMVLAGCSDWKHLGCTLHRHESSQDHIKFMARWAALEKEIKCGQCLEKEKKRTAQKHMRHLMMKAIDVINFIASRNLTLQDETGDNNFLDLLRLLSKYDYLRLDYIKELELTNKYLNQQIREKLIVSIAKTVVDEAIEKIIKAKFYAILLFREQLEIAVVLRYCSQLTGILQEIFIGSFAINETNAEHVTTKLLDYLIEKGLDIENCRGIGYDVSVASQVKDEILKVNARAFFSPCDDWNVLVADSAEASSEAKIFFGYVRGIFALISKSTEHWKSIRFKLKPTVGPFSGNIRWECRMDAVGILLRHFDDIARIIENLKNENDDTMSQCEFIANGIFSLEFVLSLHAWFEILTRVSAITKLWHSVSVDVPAVLQQLRQFFEWIKEFRDSGFRTCLADAKTFIEKMYYEFKNEFTSRKPKIIKFWEDGSLPKSPDSPQKTYKTDFFNTMIDAILTNMDSRVNALKRHFDHFGFLYDLDKIKTIPEESLLKHCHDLCTGFLLGNDKCQLDASELLKELTKMDLTCSETVENAQQLLTYMVNNSVSISAYPNVYFAVRLMLISLGRSAPYQEDLPKLDIVRGYLKGIRGEERLSAVAILTIEHKLASQVSYDVVIENFKSI